MRPDDHVCLCFHVSLRKLSAYLRREKPKVPSQLSECLNAGTGCHWCVPFLEELHRQWSAGEELHFEDSPEEYAARRKAFHRTGRRDADARDANGPHGA